MRRDYLLVLQSSIVMYNCCLPLRCLDRLLVSLYCDVIRWRKAISCICLLFKLNGLLLFTLLLLYSTNRRLFYYGLSLKWPYWPKSDINKSFYILTEYRWRLQYLPNFHRSSYCCLPLHGIDELFVSMLHDQMKRSNSADWGRRQWSAAYVGFLALRESRPTGKIIVQTNL